MSRVPASVGAGKASGIDSDPVQTYNGGDTFSCHFMPFERKITFHNF